MQNPQGVFLVLEGSDGSGKTTQFELLKNRLIDEGHDVEVFDFPRYDEPSSYFVTRYLNGQYGPAKQVNPYTASLFYALDRFEAAPEIRNALKAGKIVLSNRYVGSNMAHQGSKFKEPIEKRSFFVWEDSLEYQLLNIPRPTVNLFLRVPAEISYELIAKKAARNYTTATHDQHEGDMNHLKQSIETYDLLCQLFPRDFKAIECVKDGKLLTIEQISEQVWAELQPLLPPTKKPQPIVNSRPYLEATDRPEAEAKTPVVSEFNWEIPRLSYLAAIDIKLRLLQLKVESNCWNGIREKYSFYTPEGLSSELSAKYKEASEKIAELHLKAHAQLSEYLQSKGKIDIKNPRTSRRMATELLRSATPLSAEVSAYMSIQKDTAAETIKRLVLSRNEEVQKLGQELSAKLSETWVDLDADISEFEKKQQMPEAIGDIIEKLTRELPSRMPEIGSETVRLIEASPRNEFELIIDGLHPYSNLSRSEIVSRVANWDYSQKLSALDAALQKPAPEILDHAYYRLSFVTSWQTLLQLIDLKLVNDVQLQAVMPTKSYEAPEIIEEAVISDSYSKIFNISLDLYGQIQTEHDSQILEYATLLGHNLQWQGSVTARSLMALDSLQLQNANELAELLKQIKDSIVQTHPIIGTYLSRPSNDNIAQNDDKKPRKRQRGKRGKGGNKSR